MWIQLDGEQLVALRALVELGKSTTISSPILHKMAVQVEERIDWFSAPDANDQRYRDAVDTSDQLEMDDDAVTSIGDEGAFVMTWTYVSNQDAEIEEDCLPNDPDAIDGLHNVIPD